SPYATGDNWGATNLSLYGASHVGIFGGIIDTTNIEGILQLDICKTDYFQDNSYPTYLYYNPYDEANTVTIDVGSEMVDLYDAVANQFIVLNVSGQTPMTVPADEALLIVLVPASGAITNKEEKMLVNGVVIDYNSDNSVSNHSPRIKALNADSTTILYNQSIDIYCTAVDRDLDRLSYSWTINGETLDCDSSVLFWSAPAEDTLFTIRCTVSDGITPPVSDSIQITVIESINHPPVIEDLIASAGKIDMGDTTLITCIVSDSDGDSLEYIWLSDFGQLTWNDSLASWIAPDSVGYYFIKCTVSDNRGGEDTDSIGIVVRDSTGSQTGDPVAFYPFSGNADDHSGLNNHGAVNGADLTTNRFGDLNSAYYFNGTSDNIRVPVSASLNFTDAITVSFWMNAAELYSSRESYPISHGNWENRWKVSIITEQKIRWTVKSSDGIKDLDSKVKVTAATWYHVVGLYDGNNFEIYIDGAIDNHTTFSGAILTTNIDLMIGQTVPSVSQYNFKGIIDDVRIYDYALSVEEIEQLYGETSTIHTVTKVIPKEFLLFQNYPNPFNPQTTIQYQLKAAGNVKLEVYDLTGGLIQTIVDGYKQAGNYTIIWDARNVSSGIYLYRLQTKEFVSTKKCIKLK
ncbi:MAG: T9SS type A sorting domain-containing protein, partial [Candidatus Marinimicrobia bacterium]|nr:T9SS type A sorting domain-containing protein [Candidatus Neomarinimicrobiota bacterium]